MLYNHSTQCIYPNLYSKYKRYSTKSRTDTTLAEKTVQYVSPMQVWQINKVLQLVCTRGKTYQSF